MIVRFWEHMPAGCPSAMLIVEIFGTEVDPAMLVVTCGRAPEGSSSSSGSSSSGLEPPTPPMILPWVDLVAVASLTDLQVLGRAAARVGGLYRSNTVSAVTQTRRQMYELRDRVLSDIETCIEMQGGPAPTVEELPFTAAPLPAGITFAL